MLLDTVVTWLVNFLFRHYRPRVRYFRDDPNATDPSRHTPRSNGFDLYAAKTYEFRPGETKIVDTGIVFDFPPCLFACLWDKSSVASRKNFKVLGGVVDTDYRGRVGVILRNSSDEDNAVTEGTAVAQAVFEMAVRPDLVLAEKKSDLTETVRGERGFGGADWGR